MPPTSKLRLGLLQFNPGREVAANLDTMHRLVGQLSAPCDLLIAPENCLCLGRHATVSAAARDRESWLARLQPVVREWGCAVVFGGVPVRGAPNLASDRAAAGKRARDCEVRNCSLVLAANGELLADYAKMHLFQLNPGKPGAVDETTLYTPGTEPVAFTLNGWQVGLSICFDLRFPELYRAYASADLLLCTAAFTRQTGTAHWHTLLRARAIENQCYLAAAAVCGANPDTGLELYGHPLLVEPWGTVIAEMSETMPAALTVCLDPARMEDVRSRIGNCRPPGGER